VLHLLVIVEDLVMYRYSPITVRLFLMLLMLVGSIFACIYLVSVPLIKNNVFALELNSNRQVLNIVYDLANRIQSNTETYVEGTLKSHQQRLKSVIDMTESHIELMLKQGKLRKKDQNLVWDEIFSSIRKFQFGNKDYLWIADYDGILLSHPSDAFHQRDMSTYSDSDGKLIIPDILKISKSKGEGFYKYKWHRIDNKKVMDKYSYFKDFSKWRFVVGAGVYIDDIESEVELQKQQALLEIHKALKNIRIAGNGYIYIFDSQGNMLSHPNPNIHGKNFKERLNPVTKNQIYKDLIKVTDTDSELYYKWDRPDDPGNYSYEKLSLVKHLPGFDWYISSSVYIDDLKASSFQLSQRIITMGFLGLIGTILATFFFAEWLTSPIRKLSSTAYKVSRGNLQAKTGIKRNDELGLLAESFDYMVESIDNNVTTLNDRVRSRTIELSTSNSQLLEAIESLKKAQTELKIVETRQRLILDALPAQVAYIDHEEKYVFANEEYKTVFRQQQDSIEGKHLIDVIGQEMYQETHPYIKDALNGSVSVYEYKIKQNDRELVTRRTVLPFYGENESVVGMLVLSIDITNEREAEKRIAEASKMQVIGQMSGGLAHDFNNLLTIILGNLLEIKKNESTVGEQNLQNNLAPAIRATRRGADITKRLLAFSRRQPLTPSCIKPESLINELTDLLKAPLPDNIILKTEFNQNIPDVYVDAAQMEDALVNLVLNSIDAMPEGGNLSITISEVTHAGSKLVLDKFDEPIKLGRYALISIIDTGEGFTEDALKKAYEPFFTTKSQKAGSGLGLSMVYGFVKQSKGYIQIQNNKKYGSRVDLLLPEATNKQKITLNNTDKKSNNPNIYHDFKGSLVILVEDNDDVRIVVRSQLINMGFAVIEASSGDEALDLLSNLNTLAGIVSDVVMPGKTNGYDVAKTIKEKNPEAFVVLMTGYSEKPPETNFEYTLLQKPFDQTALFQAIFSKKNSLIKEESSL